MLNANTTELTDQAHSVFVVEDEALIAMEISDHLSGLGYEISGTASRGETALISIEKSRPDVVLMDIKLAGRMSGIETAAQLAKRCDVPVIYLTAFSDEELIAKAARTAPYGYILKPFGERELRANIEVALGKRRAEKDLRLREARARSLVEYSPESIQVLNADGLILSVNPPGVALYGAGASDRLVGEAASALVAPAYRPVFEEMVAAVARGESHALEFQIECAKGDLRQIAVNAVPIPNFHELDARPQILVIAREVMARSPIRPEVRGGQLARAAAMATGIAGHLSDHIRFILGSAEMACNDLNSKPGDPVADDLNAIVAAADSAENLLGNLLDFGGYVELERAPLQFGQVVEDALDDVESRDRSGTRISRQIDPACPPVLGDAEQLRRAVVQLCENARQSLPGGIGRIDLRLETRELSRVEAAIIPDPRASNYLVLSVTDDGYGMSEATQERIFEPFFTTGITGQRIGMGLAAARTVVEGHGGTITVQSELDEGSTFTIFLPVAMAGSNDVERLTEEHLFT